MGLGGAGYHSSRAEFLTDTSLNDNLKYNRYGGCFVTTKTALAFVIFALATLLGVVLLMYFYGPNRHFQKFIREDNDIEKLINQTVNEQVPPEELRLPKTILPLKYRLWIHPLLDEPNDQNFTFNGRVQIVVNCTKITNKIVLNWDDIVIKEEDVKIFHLVKKEEVLNSSESQLNLLEDSAMNSSLFEYNSTTPVVELIESKMLIQDVVQDEDNYKMTILTRNLLEEGHTYTLDIKFSGQILENLVGLYKTSYVDNSGQTRWLLTTHFQSIFARRVFPCFDEPSFKAQFEVNLARRTNMTALSNMPLKTTEPFQNSSDWVWDSFHTTPLMSTYILAFTIFDFENMTSQLGPSGPTIQVWTPKEDLSKAQYALNAVKEILPFLESYFAIKYPLPKLDLIAVPNFGKGAMENWGIISFRKSSLLFDPKTRSIQTKSYIFTKLAHELAHQWFGNLVTMDWWSDLWLNEGVGTFMAEVVLTNLRPRWLAYSSLQLRDTYQTLYFDGLKSTRSIQNEIKSTSQIEQTFDTKIYQKGSSLLRMLNYTLTKTVFQKGLQNYLTKYSYDSSIQDDLWKIYTQTARNQSVLPANTTIKNLMNSWTLQSGYPLVTLSRNYSSNLVQLNQSKWSEDNVVSEALWYIPVTYLTETSSNLSVIWLEKARELKVNLPNFDNTSWILLNIEETGFYRVNYDLKNWQLLKHQLWTNPGRIPVSSRGQLIDDAFQLANLGVLNYSIPFSLVKYLSVKETNYIPWYSALRNLEELEIIISNYEYSGLYETFLLRLIRPIFDEMGTKDRTYDLQDEKLLRLHLVKSACRLRYSNCIKWARNEFDGWMQSASPDEANPITVDYRYIVQCNAIKSGGINEWEFLWNRTLSPQIAPVDLKTAFLSLGCTYDPWLINRYLEYSLSGNISLEYVPYVWQSISHSVGVRTGFQFLRLNWDRIFHTYEDIYLVFSTIFHDFVAQLSTEIDLEDLTTFYKLHQNDLKSINNILQSTVDQMKIRINWKTKHLDSVVDWLKNN